MAGSEEEEQEEQTTLKLPLLPLKQGLNHHNTHSPERSELPSSVVSVPFSWEEHPGKPKHSLPHSSSSPKQLKTLELPPRLLLEREITKLSSPTMVLDGPYSMGRSRRFDSSSFRMMLMGTENCYGSFRSDLYSPGFDEVEEGNDQKVKALVSKGGDGGQNGKFGFVRLWRKRALKRRKVEFGGGSYVFPANGDSHRETDCCRKEELGFCDSHGNSKVKISETKSHFWASVYGGLKQVVPWKRTRN